MSDYDVLTRACTMAATLEREAAGVAFQRSDLSGYQQHSANASLLASLAKGLSIAQVEPQKKVPDVGKDEAVVSEWPGTLPGQVHQSAPPPIMNPEGEPGAVPIIKGHKVHKRAEPPRRRPATVPVYASVSPNERDVEE